MIRHIIGAIAVLVLFVASANSQKLVAVKPGKYSEVKLTAAEVAKVEELINQLVYSEPVAKQKPAAKTADADEVRQRFKTIQAAFQDITDMKERAFPVLVEHLGDKRPSIPFRNHMIGSTVGDACYWCVYYQLQDRPKGYSRYGHSRIGRDGKEHTQPYWAGTSFDKAGGIKPWLEQYKELTYPEMQIKCLDWLLTREKIIGAADAESYFVNILPLEIQIRKRQKEVGQNVDAELQRLETALKVRNVSCVPRELLPGK